MNRYQIQKPIGKGGYATVVAAHDTVTGQDVAIKFLKKQDAEALARFQREVLVLQSLDHPGIVKVLDSGVAGNQPYIVMELLRGLTVERLMQKARLTLRQALGIAAKVAEALHYAHAMGVVHRDVKPANAFITRERVVKLMDFGMARFIASGYSLTAAGVFMGTHDFIAPEVADGHRPTAAADMYSLGAMTYMLISGVAPFEGTDPIRVILARLTSDPPPLSDKVPDVPADIEDLVMRALARDPNHRPESLGSFAAQALAAMSRLP